MKKVLIISLKHLGDLTTTTSLLPLLKNKWPDIKIHYLLNPEAEPLIRAHKLIDNVYKCGRHLSMKQFFALAWQLYSQHYDAVIDLSEGDRGAMWGFICRAKTHVGYRSKSSHIVRNMLHTHLLPDRTFVLDRHISACHSDALKTLGLDFDSIPVPSLHHGREAGEKAAAILAAGNVQGHYVLAHWTPKEDIRMWPHYYCAKAMDWCHEHIGPVIVVAGSTERERVFIESAAASAQHKFILPAAMELDTLIALVKRAYMVIGIDSLIGHIAAAVETPLLSLFGPSSDIHWGPQGKMVRLLKMDYPCRPCLTGGCLPGNVSRCLKEMDFDAFVKTELEKFVTNIPEGRDAAAGSKMFDFKGEKS